MFSLPPPSKPAVLPQGRTCSHLAVQHKPWTLNHRSSWRTFHHHTHTILLPNQDRSPNPCYTRCTLSLTKGSLIADKHIGVVRVRFRHSFGSELSVNSAR